MEKDKTCDECGRQFSGEPYSNIEAWGYAFHVEANAVDGPLKVSVAFQGQVRAGTLARLVDTYIALCPACVAVALEVALRQIKKQAAAEGLVDLSPQPCECTDDPDVERVKSLVKEHIGKNVEATLDDGVAHLTFTTYVRVDATMAELESESETGETILRRVALGLEMEADALRGGGQP